MFIIFLVEINEKYEAQLVVQAARINTLSKLTFGDSKRFDGLLRDIFPGIDLRDIEYENLRQALHQIYQEHHLLINEMQVNIDGIENYYHRICLFEFVFNANRFVKLWNCTSSFDNVWVSSLLDRLVQASQSFGKCYNKRC